MTVSIQDTFLTESKVKNIHELPEPETMIRVREEHSRLQEIVVSLNQKISHVLAKQEGDFLAAYRAHMFTVQKELQTLRQRVIEAENALQKNDKVQKLEDECDWYRKEAIRLDKFNTAMIEDLKYMKRKVEIIEDDRKWLTRQFKACKRQNKVLRAGNQLSASAEQSLKEEPVQCHGQGESQHTLNLETSQSQPLLSGIMGSLDRVRRAPHTKSALGLTSFRPENSPKPDPDPDNHQAGLVQREGTLIRKVRMLERKLAKEQKETIRAKATRSSQAIERAEMEEFFMKCVEDVKKKIESRKLQARALHTRSTVPREALVLPGKVLGCSTRAPVDEMKLFSSKANLEDFTAADRRAVMESLLEREDVVGHLFDLFFPVASSPKGISSKGVRTLEYTTGL